MTDSTAIPPNPGSEAALAQGCKCPVIDNRYGKGIRDDRDEFWINNGCPLHGFDAEDDND
jgi:hypothetical protein